MVDLLQQLPSSIAFLLDLLSFVSPAYEAGFNILPQAIRENPLILPYEALVVAVRALEGMLIGAAVRKHCPLAFFVAMGLIVTVILVVYSRLPAPTLRSIHISWMALGTLVASLQFTRKFKEHPLFGAPAGLLIIFVVFAVVSLHVANEPTARWIYIPAFPVGFSLGYVWSERLLEDASSYQSTDSVPW